VSTVRSASTRFAGHSWLPEAFLIATCIGWLLLMGFWHQWEALPFHFIYVSVGVAYGLRMWQFKNAVIAILLVALSTGAMTLLAISRGSEAPAELVEVPLMSLIYMTMVLHVSSRQRAGAIVENLLERERRLYSNASHELMTPLTVARGEVELITQDGAPTEHRLARMQEVVTEELRRSERLVTNLLVAARMNSGGLHRERVNADDLILDEMERWHERTPCPLIVEQIACGTIEASRDDLLRVLDNLLQNAVHHTSADCVIRLSSRGVNGRLVIRVEDTGDGISADDLPHVFERFYRSERNRASGNPGSGLGLAIVRDVVEAHGGVVNISSTSGAGTAVTVELPGFEEEFPDGGTRRGGTGDFSAPTATGAQRPR
jgi:signal transduction histidine kinase